MRRLTEDVPGTGGRIRERPEDFVVEEMPLYPPSGSGEHSLFEIEKRGIPTAEAVRRLGRALGVRPPEFGVAGQKDARAVTRQWLSAPCDPARVAAARVPGVEVLSAAAHGRKLRTGHLRGNRFTIRVRGAAPGSVRDAERSLQALAAKGVPNRFGPQRFGLRGDSHLLGAELVAGRDEGFLALFLGRPGEGDPPADRRSREAYDEGALDEAMRALPGSGRDRRAALSVLLKGKGPARAVRAVPKRLRLFLVSALQSHLFNLVLGRRMPDIDVVLRGDLAWKHDSGAVFRVEDAEREAPRAERFEISPSGPMFGYRCSEPEGLPGEIEREVIASAGLGPDSFRRPGGLKSKGARRPLRAPLSGPSVERELGPAGDESLLLGFALPPGTYATVVVDEVMKSGRGPVHADRGPS